MRGTDKTLVLGTSQNGLDMAMDVHGGTEGIRVGRMRLRIPALGMTLAEEGGEYDLMHVSMAEVQVEVHGNPAREHIHLTVGGLQVDNMMPSPEYAVVLALADADAGLESQGANVVEVLVEGTVDEGLRTAEYVGIRILPLVVKIDGDLASKLMDMQVYFANGAGSGGASGMAGSSSNSGGGAPAGSHVLLHASHVSMTSMGSMRSTRSLLSGAELLTIDGDGDGDGDGDSNVGSSAASVAAARHPLVEDAVPHHLLREAGDELYIDRVEVFPLSIMLCVGDNEVGLPIVRDGVPVSIDHREQVQWFVTRRGLGPALRSLVLEDVGGLAELGLFVGSLDVIGNPLGALAKIKTGCSDFVRRPFNALVLDDTPGAFFFGLASGTYSLVKNVSDAAFMTLYKINAGLASGTARLTFDDEWVGRTRRSARVHPRNVVVGLGLGAVEFGYGMWGGTTGLVMDPVRGAQARGVGGAFLGAGKGLIGLPLKVLGGTFGFMAKTFEGLKNSTGTGQYVVQKRQYVSKLRQEVLLEAALRAWVAQTDDVYVTHFSVKVEDERARLRDTVAVVTRDSLILFDEAEVAHDARLSAMGMRPERGAWALVRRGWDALISPPEPSGSSAQVEPGSSMVPARSASVHALRVLRGVVSSARPRVVPFADISEVYTPGDESVKVVVCFRRVIGGLDRVVLVSGQRAEVGQALRRHASHAQ